MVPQRTHERSSGVSELLDTVGVKQGKRQRGQVQILSFSL